MVVFYALALAVMMGGDVSFPKLSSKDSAHRYQALDLEGVEDVR